MFFDKSMKILSVLFFICILFFAGFLSLKLFFWNDIYAEEDREKRSHLFDSESPKSAKIDKNKLQIDNEEETNQQEKQIENNSRAFSILLLGVDTNNLSGRSDTMILAVVDGDNGKVNLLSIPRDTRTKINGRNSYEKINHAHAYGLNSAIYTVEDLFQIPIDYYIKINLNGFSDLVDALGGLELNVEKNINFRDRLTKQQFYLSAGEQTLNGREALNYARFRSDGEGDYGRMRRQQQVIKEIANQSTDFRNITKLTKLLDVLGDNVKTDISFKEMVKMLLKVHSVDGEDINTLSLKSYPDMINGTSYVVIPNNELNKKKEQLQELIFNPNQSQYTKDNDNLETDNTSSNQ